MSMTPALRELLERHPAPWRVGPHCDCLVDSNGYIVLRDGVNPMLDECGCFMTMDLFVDLVNAAAAEVGR